MMPNRVGRVFNPSGVVCRRNSSHLDPVHRALGAKGLGLPVLVQQGDLGVIDIQVAGVGGQIKRLEWAAAFLMQHVQRLHQPQIVAHLGKSAVAAAKVIIHHISRATNRGINMCLPPTCRLCAGLRASA